MPFEIPNLPTLISRAEADLEAMAADALRRSDAKVFARVHGGTAYGLYGYLGNLARQIMPDSCDEDVLRRWAAMRNVERWQPVAASGVVLAEGASGSIVGRGRIWQRQDGLQFVVSEDTALAEGEATPVPVAALSAGALGNTDAGVKLELVSPISGVLSRAVVGPDGLTGGLDEERLDDWRARVIESFRIVPHGGNADDYASWAKEVPGVTRAWVGRNYMGPGTVGLFFVRDNDEDILPGPAQITEVHEHIETVRPVTAELYVMAPTLLPVVHEIELRPDSELLRMRVERSLRDMYAAEAELGGRLYWTHFGQAISNTAGEVDHRVLLPADDIVPGVHELPVFGGIVWR